MALLEYDIQYDEKKKTSNVTLKVVGVERNDKIRFKSNYPKTSIEFKDGSPFKGPDAPKANDVFKVGNGARGKGPFKVSRDIKTSIHFDCGERQQDGFYPWGSGADVPGH
jgi:hypothetical protein